MKNILPVFCLLFATHLVAQPVVMPDTRDVLGQELPIKFYADFTGSEGTEGENQTWDFSFLQGITPTSSFSWLPQEIPNTGFQDSFPDANLAIQVPPELLGRDSAEAYFYYDVAEDGKLHFYGYAAVIPDSAFANEQDTFYFIYDDPALDAAFPTTYEDVFTDTWSRTTSFETDTFSFVQYTKADRTLTSDGYGTLITPAGTFTNALRVRREEVVRDSTVIIGIPVPGTTQVTQRNIYWDWYAPGEPYLLMQITQSRLFQAGFEVSNSTSAFFRDRGPSTNVQEFLPTETIELKAYPNPAMAEVKLDFNLEKPDEVMVQLVSLQGQLVREIPGQRFLAGGHTLTVDVQDLPTGTYFALVAWSDGRTRVPVIVQR